jgi:hypothetical protein
MEFTQGSAPGTSALQETAEWKGVWKGENGESLTLYARIIIGSTSTDSGNTGYTTTLRAGTLLAKKTSDGKYYPYSATATDGTQNPIYVLPQQLSMLNPLGVAEDKDVVVYRRANLLVGMLTASDEQALRALAVYGFTFDVPQGAQSFAFARGTEVVSADTTLTASDSGKRYICITNAVTFTLPTIAAGLTFEFRNTANVNMAVTGAAANLIVTDGNGTASTITFSTASHKIGSACRVFAVQYGATLLWHVDNLGGTLVTPS